MACTIASPSPRPPASRERPPSRRWKRSKTAGALIDGDPRAVVVDDEAQAAVAGLHAERDQAVRRGVGDRVLQQVAQRLGETVLVGLDDIRGSRRAPGAAVGASANPRTRSVRNGLRSTPTDAGTILARLREQQHVLDEPAHALDLRPHELLDAPHLRRRRTVGHGEHLELAADHRQRRAQLVRGVGDEAALAIEGVLSAVEHVIEGLGQHPHLVLTVAVSIRGESSPPSTRAATAPSAAAGAPRAWRPAKPPSSAASTASAPASRNSSRTARSSAVRWAPSARPLPGAPRRAHGTARAGPAAGCDRRRGARGS